MTWRDAMGLAASNLRGGFVRTVLTILGLGVGVGAVLTVLTLGSAGEARVEDEIAKLGVDKVWIRAKDDDHTLCQEDAERLYQLTQSPACAAAYTAAVVSAGSVSAVAQVAGFDSSMAAVYAPKVLEGRNLLQQDFEQGSLVCLVDEALAEHLGGDVLGKRVNVANRRLRVVGVIKGMTNQTMAGGTGLLIMPLATCLSTLGGAVSEITLSVQRNQQAEAVAEQALFALSDDDGYRADTLEKEINAAREVVRIFVMVLVCVALVCMLTGGIGVMNILLVSVRERRREIGLLKAIGATSGQVGLLFLLEAGAYAFLGGILGLMLGVAMIHVFGSWIGLNAYLELFTALPVLIGASLLGMGFGVAPAMKAAGLPPVEALNSQ